jgi:hypothetical protein
MWSCRHEIIADNVTWNVHTPSTQYLLINLQIFPKTELLHCNLTKSFNESTCWCSWNIHSAWLTDENVINCIFITIFASRWKSGLIIIHAGITWTAPRIKAIFDYASYRNRCHSKLHIVHQKRRRIIQIRSYKHTCSIIEIQWNPGYLRTEET